MSMAPRRLLFRLQRNTWRFYEGVIELHELVEQLGPSLVGKLCVCELVVDLHDERLTTSWSVLKSSCRTDGLMY